MAALTSSFQSRRPGGLSGGSLSLPGCKSSLTTSQAITSCGSTGLNQIFGGGVPVGTVTVFEDKPFPLHSKRFLQVFAAEGLSCGHYVSIVTVDTEAAEEFVSGIPTKTSSASAGAGGDGRDFPRSRPDELDHAEPGNSDALKIAWRYETMPKVNPVLGVSATGDADSEYDFAKKLDPSDRERISIFSAPSFSGSSGASSPLSSLLSWIRSQINQPSAQKTVHRICLSGIDSPLWDCHDRHEFARFLFQLRAIVRSTNTVIFLYVSNGLHDNYGLSRIRKFSDAYIVMENLQDSTKSALYREFQAICRIQKLFSVNTLRPVQTTDTEFGYKFKRRKIVLERLHLPPELAETAQRETSDVKAKSGGVGPKNMSCQSSAQSNLDF